MISNDLEPDQAQSFVVSANVNIMFKTNNKGQEVNIPCN